MNSLTLFSVLTIVSLKSLKSYYNSFIKNIRHTQSTLITPSNQKTEEFSLNQSEECEESKGLLYDLIETSILIETKCSNVIVTTDLKKMKCCSWHSNFSFVPKNPHSQIGASKPAKISLKFHVTWLQPKISQSSN